MTFKEFAEKWIKDKGLSDPDADYGGALAKSIMELVEVFAKQGHSGGSAALVLSSLHAISIDYERPTHPIWREHWKSERGISLMRQTSKDDAEFKLMYLELTGEEYKG